MHPVRKFFAEPAVVVVRMNMDFALFQKKLANLFVGKKLVHFLRSIALNHERGVELRYSAPKGRSTPSMLIFKTSFSEQLKGKVVRRDIGSMDSRIGVMLAPVSVQGHYPSVYSSPNFALS